MHQANLSTESWTESCANYRFDLAEHNLNPVRKWLVTIDVTSTSIAISCRSVIFIAPNIHLWAKYILFFAPSIMHNTSHQCESQPVGMKLPSQGQSDMSMLCH